MHLANKETFLFVWNVCQLVADDCKCWKRTIGLWGFSRKMMSVLSNKSLLLQ